MIRSTLSRSSACAVPLTIETRGGRFCRNAAESWNSGAETPQRRGRIWVTGVSFDKEILHHED